MKWRGWAVHGAITVSIALLLVLSMLVVVVRDACSIREQLLEETQERGSEALTDFVTVQNALDQSVSRQEQLVEYYGLMADNEDGLSLSHPVRQVSFIYGARGRVLARSRNMLLADIVWKDGTEERIPMVFAYENSVDIVDLVENLENIENCAYQSYVDVTGYWQDSLFYVQSLSYGSASYESPEDPPEDAEQETMRLCYYNRYGSDGWGTISSLTLRGMLKYYGGDVYSAFVSQWERDDSLIQDYFARWTTQPTERDQYFDNVSQEYFQGNGTQVERRSLWKTRVMARVSATDRTGSGGYIYYVYLAEFSPLGLAWDDLTDHGVMLMQTTLFLLVALFLNMYYGYDRKRELRAYQDEITRQRQALDYAKNAEQSRREMTSAIAHELKTPIAVLSSYAEALQENIDAEKQDHYLSVIREETGKMDRMVLELLDLSRLEAGKYRLRREQFDLEALVRERIEPLEPQIRQKELKLEYRVWDPMVNADPYRMGQIVENFMTNAIRHTPQGGKIILRVGTEQETFSVENQGKPIPAEHLDKVWETFWQGDASRNERGSGLGLAICRTIVALHGGSCKAENTGLGVRFSVSLEREKQLFQLGHMDREAEVALDYPIAQAFTTVKSVMTRLELLTDKALRQEVQEGNISIGGEPVRDVRARLYPGYTLHWKEFRITIRLDERDKRRFLLLEQMRTGGLGNPDKAKSWGFVATK